MPRFSCFTPFGQLRCSSKPSRWESFYRQLVDSYGETFDLTVGTHAEAKLYALSCLVAAGYELAEQLHAERDPRKLYKLLRQREREFGIAPDPTLTLEQRRAVIASRMLASSGSSKQAITLALQTLLGAGFVALRTTTSAGGEPGVWPNVSPVTGAVGVFEPGTNAPKFGLTLDSVMPGTRWVPYFPLSDSERLVVGDVVSLQLENSFYAERVTVNAVQETYGIPYFQANYVKPHERAVSITTAPMIAWSSRYRHLLIVVTDDVSNSLRARGQINELMRRIVRASASWSIVTPTSAGVTGPMVLGGKLGTKPSGAISY